MPTNPTSRSTSLGPTSRSTSLGPTSRSTSLGPTRLGLRRPTRPKPTRGPPTQGMAAWTGTRAGSFSLAWIACYGESATTQTMRDLCVPGSFQDWVYSSSLAICRFFPRLDDPSVGWTFELSRTKATVTLAAAAATAWLWPVLV